MNGRDNNRGAWSVYWTGRFCFWVHLAACAKFGSLTMFAAILGPEST